MNFVKIGILLLLLSSCKSEKIEEIDPQSKEMENFIERFAKKRNTDLVLMGIKNLDDSTEISLYDLYSTCLLAVGDEFGFHVDEKWMNITAPLFKTKINSIDVYIETGIEKIYKSRNRYQTLLEELDGRVALCVKSYNSQEDSFMVTAPRTSTQMPWKMIINDAGTFMNTYESKREGYDDFYYQIEKIRIDTNYREKYY